jgi:hypothetical protein
VERGAGFMPEQKQVDVVRKIWAMRPALRPRTAGKDHVLAKILNGRARSPDTAQHFASFDVHAGGLPKAHPPASPVE